MQKRLIALLEEIKLNRYYDYHDYLNNEDIDLRPYEDYIQLITYLADEYQFDKTKFLEIYKSFKDLLYK